MVSNYVVGGFSSGIATLCFIVVTQEHVTENVSAAGSGCLSGAAPCTWVATLTGPNAPRMMINDCYNISPTALVFYITGALPD